MSLRVDVKVEGFSEAELATVAGALRDTARMNARVAGETERWVKGPQVAGRVSAEQHRTANTLGANPTQHLTRAYQQIYSESDATGARLLVPRASRLRAAFGTHTIKPTGGRKFLTIPAAREAYGRRAGEFPEGELFPIRKAGAKTLLLARRNGAGIQTMYVLVPEATIPEDRTLIPFDEMGEVARLAVDDYIDDALEATLPPETKGGPA